MAKLFNIDMAGILFQAMGPKLLQISLQEPVTGARDPGNPSAGQTSTTTFHKSRGFVETYAEKYFPQSLITTGDKVVAVFGKPLPNDPLPGWGVIVEGEDYLVIKVERDPARVMFQLLCRGHT